MADIQVGDPAPDFTLPKTGGGTLSLRDLRGHDVILYFYPKDYTSGCTKEACNFRDAHDNIESANAVVLGVSPDRVESHDKFAAKHRLPFALLADTDHRVAEMYGVWVQKSLYGRKYMGIERSTFLIDADGKITQLWRQVQPRKHISDVMEAISTG